MIRVWCSEMRGNAPSCLRYRYDLGYMTQNNTTKLPSIVPAQSHTTVGSNCKFELLKKAAHEEISSLEKKGSWAVVKRSSAKSNILPSNCWALKQKRYPDGRIRKYKARFCVRGDQQWYGLDYEERYAPIVQWLMVRMMLTLTMKLGLRTKQVDYSNAFVQADIDGDVYCELPTELLLAGGKLEYILKLKKSLYGLKQAPLLWFKSLEKSLSD